MRELFKLVILGLVQNEKGEYLISQRYDPKVAEAHLKWDIPGGTNEFGETPEETVKREMEEETGLSVSVGAMLPVSASRVWEHEDYTMHTIVLCYRCSIVEGVLETKDAKIAQLKWVSLNELSLYDFLPTTQKIIDMILYSK